MRQTIPYHMFLGSGCDFGSSDEAAFRNLYAQVGADYTLKDR